MCMKMMSANTIATIANHILIFFLFVFVHGRVAADTISVVDDTQRTITLEKPAQRVIALAPHIVENVFTIGGGDRIVGAVAYSDYPVAAKSIPIVGNYASLNLEQVVALKPDLIIAWRSGGSARALEKLIKLGYPVYFGEPKSTSHIANELENYGALLGLQQSAKDAADTFLENMHSLREAYASKTKVNVFYQIWNDPLQTIGGNQLISDVIALCGGVNIFHDAPSIAPLVSREAVVGLNPDVIATGERAAEESGGLYLSPPALEMWKKYPMINAVKHDQLVGVHPDWMHRHSVRIFNGASVLCQALDRAR